MELDRRAHRRAVLDRPVLIETSRRTSTVRSLDVSGGGLRVRADLDAAVGERVTVYFELPIGFGIEADAEVWRRDGDTLALRFVALPREFELAIRGFCRISGLRPAAVAPTPSDPLPARGPGAPSDPLPARGPGAPSAPLPARSARGSLAFVDAAPDSR